MNVDFVQPVTDWLAECSRPAPRCPISPFTTGTADELWATLSALGVRRDAPWQSIGHVCRRNPRAQGLEQLLTHWAAAASLAEGAFLPALCSPRWDSSRSACTLETGPALSRYYCVLRLDDLAPDHPYAIGFDRDRLGGSVLYAEAEGSYTRAEIGQRYPLEACYRATAEVNQRYAAWLKRQENEERRREHEAEMDRECRRRAEMTPELEQIERLAVRIAELEALTKEKQ